MATFAPDQDNVRNAELDERVRRAWTAYKDHLSDLQGQEYADAEAESWDRLQGTLREIEHDRTDLSAESRAR